MNAAMLCKGSVLLGCCLALLVAAGCVSPGEVQENYITRYQETLTKRSPQPRAGADGLDLLTPLLEQPELPLPSAQDELTGRQVVVLSLDDCIKLALRNSLDIRLVGFDVAISRDQMLQAAGQFDAVVFGGIQQQIVDHQRNTLNSTVPRPNSKTTSYEMGVKQQTPLGGQWQLKWDVTRAHNARTAVFGINPQAESITALEITQPLLRGGGSDYALANVRLARIGNKSAYAQFRQKVEEVVNQIQTGYWTLVLARGNLLIQQGVLQEATDTLDKVEKRLGLDAAKNLEYKQSLAAQKQRQATVVRAAKNVGDAEDQLVRVLADPRILLDRSVGIKTTVSDPDAPEIHLGRTEQLLAAIRYSPLIEQVRYNIQSADINIQTARNELLPSLNLVASTGIEGLERRVGEAIESSFSFDFIDYAIGLVFEYPIANRTAKGKLSQRQNERRKSLTDLQNLADQLAAAIRESLRQIETTQVELAAQQEAINAWSDNLSALDAAMEVGKQSYLLVLQLKLQAQESRAQARLAALAAKVAYWVALARLEQLKGTSLQEHNISLALEAATDFGERVEGKKPPLRLPEGAPPPAPPTSASTPSTISTIVGGGQ